ncbi:MAG: penicillin-binding protein 2, partial [Streptomyces sp.]|nr:penicillin-binding protein 2 [Streptomyces sp.]
MARHIRHSAFFCALLLVALLVNAVRIQIFNARTFDDNPANRRATIARYERPRGNILVGGRSVTGSRDSGEQLRYERTYTDG